MHVRQGQLLNDGLADTVQHLAHLLTSGQQHLLEASFEHLVRQLPPTRHTADVSAAEGLDDPARQAEDLWQWGRLHAAEELLYVWSVHQLAAGGIQLLTSIEQLNPQEDDSTDGPAGFVDFTAIHSLFSPAIADTIIALVEKTVGPLDADPGFIIMMDRTSAAILYAGNAQCGYYMTAMAHLADARDSATAMLQHGKTLSRAETWRISTYRSVEAWHAAVRHAGGLFHLSDSGSDEDDPLPYPALKHASTRPNLQRATEAKLEELYSPPGEPSAASEEARGSGESRKFTGGAAPLPEADLVAMHPPMLRRLLLDAAALGSMLFEAERAAETAGYQLTLRDLSQPPSV